jgi:hypothetical protein
MRPKAPARSIPRHRTRLLLAILASAGLAVLPSVAAPAAARADTRAGTEDPHAFDYMDSETLATMRRQGALQPALQMIWTEQNRVPESGFAGVAFEGDGLTLYWKGALTPGMEAALVRARRVGPVTVKAAPFSEAELRAESDKVHRMIKQLGATDVQGVGLAPDGTGLYVTRQPVATQAAFAARRKSRGKAPIVPADRLVAQAGVRVPVRFDTATHPVEMGVTRFTDFEPWNGGGKWVNVSANAQCTTGFGVHSGGHSYVLTAAHCASAGDYLTSANGTYMGPVAVDDWAYDILLIDTDGWHVMFDGPRNTSSTKNVNGWTGWASGELVCQSGQISGTVCNIRQLYEISISFPPNAPDSDGDWGYTVYGMIKSWQIDGGIAFRGGDSGGPVFTIYGSGVIAKGISSAGAESPYLYFQDWNTIGNRLGAYPNINGTIS